ncbi:zinc finger protein 775-like isoform X1 [Schistocerca serialis cubense]|uniref:zinc finger protein 775-like isoform X1 n=2 Tax=Schistocerca serialis cubense TaxID=2023355 RepID=UPI00214E1405|nr:zinc finger protein 775-like isoform X1 [Schistocerca serialis cubense]
MEGEDLRTWKNKLSEHHLGPVADGLCIKNEPLARMQCQLASVGQDPGAQIHGHPPWDPSEIKREPGMGIDCQGHQGHGPGPGMENFSPPRDFNPGKVTGCLLMCGQTPTLVFVEGSWPGGPNGGGGDGSCIPGGPPQLQGHPGMHLQPHPGPGPVPGGPPYPPGLPWQYQCPRCDRRFATLQELRSHEPGSGVLCRTPTMGPPPVPPGPGSTRGGLAPRGRGGRGGGRTPRKKKAPGSSGGPGRAGGDSTETKEEPTGRFVCSVCEKVFSEEQYYDVHMRMNTFKPFPCTICKSHFGSESSLSNHTKHFHKEKHKCPFCTRQYTWKIRLHNHMKEHMEEQILVGVFGT